MTMPNSRFFTLVVFLFFIISITGCISIKESWQSISAESSVIPNDTATPTIIDSLTVQFALESAVLDQNAQNVLSELGLKAQKSAPATVAIMGFTDVTGSERYNKKLSIHRAMAVKAFLDTLPLDKIYITASGQGEMTPIADNRVRSGREKNRRAEITLRKM